MASSDSEGPDAAGPADTAQDEAQRAADGLKGQIEALRDRVRSAKAHLAAARRPKERRSFEE